MSEKEIAKIENSILLARKEGLLKASDTTMNSHGKLWGIDVFSWINPNPVVLSATMESFPFPILWIASMEEYSETLAQNNLIDDKIHHTILLRDKASFVLENEKKKVSQVSTMNEAFENIEKLKIKPSILLFTYSLSDWEYQRKRFKDYLSLVQVK
jgi:hypothetical protein